MRNTDRSTGITQTVYMRSDVPRPDSSLILYTRSRDYYIMTMGPGNIISRNNGRDPVCCLDADANIFAVWMGCNGLMFQRSFDKGTTWLPEEKPLIVVKAGWKYAVDSVALQSTYAISCDMSKGEHSGRLYICWDDAKFSEEDKDVFLMYSDDKGDTWTEPILVTYNPNHRAQFSPAMLVDEHTGDVNLVYYDKQNYADGKLTDIYLAQSNNGGLKFDYVKVNRESFAFRKSVFEWPGFAASQPVKICWTQEDKKKQPVCRATLLNDSSWQYHNSFLKNTHDPVSIEKTLVFSENMKIPFQLSAPVRLTAVITRPLDPAFKKTLLKNKLFTKGAQVLQVNAKALGLETGNYTLILYYNGTNRFSWITEE